LRKAYWRALLAIKFQELSEHRVIEYPDKHDHELVEQEKLKAFALIA
jgi:hypothetical protein